MLGALKKSEKKGFRGLLLQGGIMSILNVTRNSAREKPVGLKRDFLPRSRVTVRKEDRSLQGRGCREKVGWKPG